MYESTKIVIAMNELLANDFINVMETSHNTYEYLPEKHLGRFEGFNNLTFIFLVDYQERTDINEILIYAHEHGCDVLYIEYWKLLCPTIH